MADTPLVTDHAVRVRYARLPLGFVDRAAGLSHGQGADILLMRLALSPSRRTLPGVLRVGPGGIVDEIGWPETTLRRYLRELEDAGLIAFDRALRVLHVRGLILADPPRSLSSLTACARDVLEIPACVVRDGILAECLRALANHALLDDWQRMIGVHHDSHGEVQSEGHGEVQSEGHSTHARTRARSVPDPVPDPATDTEPGADDARFARWWSVYPKHVAKQAAWKAWQKLKVSDDQLERMLAVLALQKPSPDWTKDGGKYIPHPATYLNQGRWEDEIPVSSSDGPVYDRYDECSICEDVHKVGECPRWLCGDCRQYHDPDRRCTQRVSREFREQEAREIAALAEAEGVTLEQAREAHHARRMAAFREGLRSVQRPAS